MRTTIEKPSSQTFQGPFNLPPAGDVMVGGRADEPAPAVTPSHHHTITPSPIQTVRRWLQQARAAGVRDPWSCTKAKYHENEPGVMESLGRSENISTPGHHHHYQPEPGWIRASMLFKPNPEPDVRNVAAETETRQTRRPFSDLLQSSF